MKKLQTLSELINGMNEFEKFMFFRRRAEDLDRIWDAIRLLYEYGGLLHDAVRVRMHVSEKRWDSYMDGTMPLPWDFIYKFDTEFAEEIKAALQKKDDEKIKKYFSFNRQAHGLADIVKDQYQSSNEAALSPSNVAV
jgi:hypothetical protein